MAGYDPRDWYWIVGGGGPHVARLDEFTGDARRVFSSARNKYVAATDATYLAWKATQVEENGFDPTTRIDTEASLSDVLATSGITAKFA
jgi:hypothetical protein